MSYGREQWFVIAAVVSLLIGAVFMLISVFAAAYWALWTGVAFAVLAAVIYGIVLLEQRRFSKKFMPSKAEQEAVEGEAVVSVKHID